VQGEPKAGLPCRGERNSLYNGATYGRDMGKRKKILPRGTLTWEELFFLMQERKLKPRAAIQSDKGENLWNGVGQPKREGGRGRRQA